MGAVATGVLMSVFAAVVAHAQTDIGTPLMLGDCVVRTLAHGFDMELKLLDLEIAKNDLPIARSEFHPVVSADAGKSSSRLPQTAESLRLRSDTVDTRVGVAQRFWPGTVVSFSSDLNRLTAAPSLNDFNPTYSSGVALNLTQPLMRGFGGINTVRPLTRPIRKVELTWPSY